jgi:trans-aconitate methyltransferase
MGWDAEAYDRDFSFVTTYGSALLDLLEAQPGERVLDLGCGTGHQTAELTRRGAEAVGVDSDPAMVERARLEHPGTTYVLADAQHLTADGPLAEPFDAVVSNAALHWMPDQESVITGVRGLLRPGGRFVAEQGGAGNVARVWSAVQSAAADLELPRPEHPWTFPTPAEQATRLERAGFAVRLVQLFDRPTPLADGTSAAGWVEMFGRDLLATLPEDGRAALLERVDAHAETLGLHQADGWLADYVRLRFLAEATWSEPGG